MINIPEIREEITSNVGSNVKIVSKGTRNRVSTYHGTISEAYHSVFVVEVDAQESDAKRMSYNYIDILTNVIEIEILKG